VHRDFHGHPREGVRLSGGADSSPPGLARVPLRWNNSPRSNT